MKIEAKPKLARSASRVYDRVQQMAITYAFKPGERINEVELAAKLNVSRTPLRESLNRLVAEGFLVVKPNLGFFRRSLDPEEVYHLYDLRCSLEVQSSKLAAERATDEAMESLVQMVSAEEEPDNELELLRQDEAFHIKIAELTGNPELVNMLRGVNNRIHFARWIDRRARRNSREEHIAIARAIASRDPDEAGRLMDSHIRRRYQQIVEIIKIGYGEIFAGANEISSISADNSKTAAE